MAGKDAQSGDDAQLQSLRDRIDALQQTVARQQQRIEQLENENQRLRDQLDKAQRQAARQAAPFRRRKQLKKPKDQQGKPGRKKGHDGAHRAVPEYVDHHVDVPLPSCPGCGGSVDGVTELVQYIEEIPPVRPIVTKLTTYDGCCSRCGDVCSTHPLQTSRAGGAARVQLGPRALALAAMLNKQHGLSMRKTCRVLEQLCGLRLTPGGLSQAMDRVADKSASLYENLRDQLRASDAVHADETSWWVGGPGHWLWVFCNENITYYHVDDNRSSRVVEQTLGDAFAGVLISDCLSSYDPIDCRKHKCIAHHLRAIAKARELPTQDDNGYLDEWSRLFKTVITLENIRDVLLPDDFVKKRQRMRAWANDLLARPVHQPGDVSVRNRLQKQADHLLTCLDELSVDPTNNRAERDLRPAVIARKLSCGNKTDNGRQTWQILASLTATCQKLGVCFIDTLLPHLAVRTLAG